MISIAQTILSLILAALLVNPLCAVFLLYRFRIFDYVCGHVAYVQIPFWFCIFYALLGMIRKWVRHSFVGPQKFSTRSDESNYSRASFALLFTIISIAIICLVASSIAAASGYRIGWITLTSIIALPIYFIFFTVLGTHRR